MGIQDEAGLVVLSSDSSGAGAVAIGLTPAFQGKGAAEARGQIEELERTAKRYPATARIPLLVRIVKRSADIVASLLLIALLSPLLAFVAYAVSRSGRPILFSQPRIGLNGRQFKCYKFRSMVPDAERALEVLLEQRPELHEEWTRCQKLQNDPRITRIGAIIRKTSIDELPQLWNVLIGDMSLVGPRPILVNQLPLYGRSAKWYTAMRPGITGLWQVTARGDGDFFRRMALDCHYVRNYRLHLDVIILFKTFRVVFEGRGAV